ncbi:hypothetical protein NW801_19800 [Brevibacillus laterosporus]|uniref:Uncharacterized protein n=1 Tax=Brevibacillus halotolerans TaxID=1507437 RepID=A0ABT4I1U6_9BACL|nr:MULTISPECIES: hypothetical protein [Brevibacillus]MCR8987250.1 hypothetical protein [Brevibacillus laterosporus]MCZ0832987.1 hypothetical protein [Brevibacillus halotolerans]
MDKGGLEAALTGRGLQEVNFYMGRYENKTITRKIKSIDRSTGYLVPQRIFMR